MRKKVALLQQDPSIGDYLIIHVATEQVNTVFCWLRQPRTIKSKTSGVPRPVSLHPYELFIDVKKRRSYLVIPIASSIDTEHLQPYLAMIRRRFMIVTNISRKQLLELAGRDIYVYHLPITYFNLLAEDLDVATLWISSMVEKHATTI